MAWTVDINEWAVRTLLELRFKKCQIKMSKHHHLWKYLTSNFCQISKKLAQYFSPKSFYFWNEESVAEKYGVLKIVCQFYLSSDFAPAVILSWPWNILKLPEMIVTSHINFINRKPGEYSIWSTPTAIIFNFHWKQCCACMDHIFQLSHWSRLTWWCQTGLNSFDLSKTHTQFAEVKPFSLKLKTILDKKSLPDKE